MSVKRICVSKHPVDRDDAVARLENYESEIFRTDGIHRKQLMAAVAKCVDLIADMPVIDAIPIEWIKHWVTKDGFSFPNWLNWMLYDWQKEQEKQNDNN